MLEAIVYEAIFQRKTKNNMEEPAFITNLDNCSGKAISSVNDSIDYPLSFVKQSVFSAMTNDQHLKDHLLSYLDENKYSSPNSKIKDE